MIEEKKKRHAFLERLRKRKDPRSILLGNAQQRARKLDLPFNLSLEDIIIPSVCPVLGLELKSNEWLHKDNSPSLDRIDPKLGYVKDNIQVLSYKANSMKQNATPEELIRFAQWVLKTYTH